MAAPSPQRDNIPIAFYKQLIDNLYDGVYFVDAERRITYWNRGAERLTGYSAEEIVGRKCFDDLLSHVNEAGCRMCSGECPLAQTIRDSTARESQMYLRHKAGHQVPVSVRVTPITDEQGTVVGAVEVFSDNSQYALERRRAGELEKAMLIDHLTHLPNRRALELRLKHAHEDALETGSSYGVLMFDLDRFKQVNDTYGHMTGDAVLTTVANTLRIAVRDQDYIGRWGGEEFLAIIETPDVATLRRIGERCRILVSQCAVPRGDGERVRVTISGGGTIVSAVEPINTALVRADAQLYASKRNGRDQVTI